MASNPSKPIVARGNLTTAFQTIYAVPSGATNIDRAVIDAVVFNNYSSSSATFTVRVVQTGTSDELNEVITEKSIRAKSNDLAPAMIGQAINSGGYIEVKASANNAINMTMTGTEITS